MRSVIQRTSLAGLRLAMEDTMKDIARASETAAVQPSPSKSCFTATLTTMRANSL